MKEFRFSLRIPEDLHERLVAEAAADDRSLNMQIVRLLKEALAARSSATPRAKAGKG